ncbi:DUF2795 domain-containing protein [Salinactinospora qingdaonensis]|uniref:DUF2795 domain-containing protein n=1 Tax=Salinactinospora qingdaonensis TaxID=702744 RepID=A0ABP7FDJ3_9ACTN
MTATTTTQRLQAALDAVDYPADKDELVATAQENEADEDTVRALQALPPQDYRSFSEITASVELAEESNPATDRGKAQARRHHRHPHLAERDKDAPTNPIVDELGENRGS